MSTKLQVLIGSAVAYTDLLTNFSAIHTMYVQKLCIQTLLKTYSILTWAKYAKMFLMVEKKKNLMIIILILRFYS